MPRESQNDQEVKNSLLRTQPEIAAEWHPSKNGNLRPEDVTAGTHQKAWWQCSKGDDHEWEASIVSRARGAGCPCCSGRKATRSTCLTVTHSEIAKEWHPTKNEALTPADVCAGSGKKVWWLCPKGADHEWAAIIQNRTKGGSCPFCKIGY